MQEFLDSDRIRYQVSYQEGELIEANSLVLICGLGRDKNPAKLKHNYSCVSFHQPQARKIVEFANEALSEWGKSYGDYSHKAKEVPRPPKEELPLYKTTGCIAIKIEPFCINGPKKDDYVAALDVFGKMMAQAVYEFMSSRNEIKKLPGMYG